MNNSDNGIRDEDSRQWEVVEEAIELLLDGNHHDALYALRNIVKADPGNAYAFHYIGVVLFELGRFDACVDAYRAALKLRPKYLAARVGLSQSLRVTDDIDGAIREARVALKQSPGDSDALFALGLSLAAARDVDGAIRTLEEFLGSNPEFEVATEAQALLHKLRERSDRLEN